MALNLSRKVNFLQFCADFNKKPMSVKAIYIFHLKVLTNRAYFNLLLCAVPARSALFDKRNAFFSTKTSKNTCRLRGVAF